MTKLNKHAERLMAAAAATALERANKLAVARNNYRVRTKPYKMLKIYRTKNNSFIEINISLNQTGYVIGDSNALIEQIETALRKGHGVRLNMSRINGPATPDVSYSYDTLEIPCAKYHYSYRSVAISKEELLAWGKAHGYAPVDLLFDADECYKILSQYGEGIKKTVKILNYSRWTQTRQRECWSKIMRYNSAHGTHFFLDKKKYLLTKLDLFNEQDMNEFGLTKESIKEIIKMAPAYGLDSSDIYRGYELEYIETDEDSEDGIWVKIHDPDGKSDLDYARIAELQFCLDWLRLNNMLMPGFLIEDGKLYYEKADAVYHGTDFEKASSSCDIDDAGALVVRDSTYYEEVFFDFPTEAEDFVTRRRTDDNEKEDEPEYMAPPDPKNLDEIMAYEAYQARCLEWKETEYSRITTSNRNVTRNTLMRVLEDPIPAPYTGKTHQIPHETVEETEEPLSPWEVHQHTPGECVPKTREILVFRKRHPEDDIKKTISDPKNIVDRIYDIKTPYRRSFDEVVAALNDERYKASKRPRESWGYPNPYSGKHAVVPKYLGPQPEIVWYTPTEEQAPVRETRKPGDLRTERHTTTIFKDGKWAGKIVTITTIETVLKTLPKLPGESEKTILVDEVVFTKEMHYDATGKWRPSNMPELPFITYESIILKALLK